MAPGSFCHLFATMLTANPPIVEITLLLKTCLRALCLSLIYTAPNEPKYYIFRGAGSKATPAEESPDLATRKPQSDASDKNKNTVRWNQTSQKRDSYVSAISSSQLNLERLSKRGESLTMEEILLLQSRERRGGSNREERNGVLDMVKYFENLFWGLKI